MRSRVATSPHSAEQRAAPLPCAQRAASRIRTPTMIPEPAVSAATTKIALRAPRASAGIAKVAPESIHAYGRRAPCRMGAVADRGDERWVHRGGTDSHGERSGDPRAVAVEQRERRDAQRLEPEAGDDQLLPSDVVGPRSRAELGQPPGRRVESRDDTDASDGEPLGRKEDRH